VVGRIDEDETATPAKGRVNMYREKYWVPASVHVVIGGEELRRRARRNSATPAKRGTALSDLPLAIVRRCPRAPQYATS
jgi:hypothetical protein